MIFKEDDYVIQPANVQAVYCVTSIGVANTPRRVVYAPTGVSNNEIYAERINFVDNYAMINAENLTGDIRLKPGFNCAILQNQDITIHARPGAGASLLETQSEEIPVTSEEYQLLDDGKYLSRGLKCHEVVATINDVQGPMITLTAGSGITLDTESEPHTIILKKEISGGMDACEIPGCN